MIERWNNVVKPEDRVYHLGDFAFGKGSREKIPEYVKTLHGKIILTKGNHDRQTNTWYQNAGFYQVIEHPWTYNPKKKVIFSHFPQPNKGMINVHGHIHNLYHIHPSGLYVNMSVEVIGYTPINLEELLDEV